jgi:hypothetical protein
MRQLEPPMPATRSFKYFSPDETDFVILVFAEKKLPIKMKYVKE